MYRNTWWLFVIMLIVYLTLVFGNEALESKQSNALLSHGSTDLEDEARTRKHRHRLWHLWGWHALAIAYWIKVKLIIVGFFVGSAVFVALRYIWPSKCTSGIVHDSPTIVYDHPPPSFAHDHIPYSLDHSPHFDHSFTSSNSLDPYSGYAGSYSEDITATVEEIPSTGPVTHRIKRRSSRPNKSNLTQQRQQRETPVKTEERIAELVFEFLGLDSVACRRRFVCEMEFRSRLNSLSSMAFRIVGRGFFEKYTNGRNEFGQAQSFAECAAVNPECVFIEHNLYDENIPENTEEKISAGQEENEIASILEENHKSSDEVNASLEMQNEAVLRAERRHKRSNNRSGLMYKSVASLILEPMQ